METSVSLLERLAGAPTDDDWRRLLDLYQPLLHAWMARAGVPPADVDDLAQDVLLVVFREVGGFERRGMRFPRAWGRGVRRPGDRLPVASYLRAPSIGRPGPVRRGRGHCPHRRTSKLLPWGRDPARVAGYVTGRPAEHRGSPCVWGWPLSSSGRCPARSPLAPSPS
jgi:hypothetical protein